MEEQQEGLKKLWRRVHIAAISTCVLAVIMLLSTVLAPQPYYYTFKFGWLILNANLANIMLSIMFAALAIISYKMPIVGLSIVLTIHIAGQIISCYNNPDYLSLNMLLINGVFIVLAIRGLLAGYKIKKQTAFDSDTKATVEEF